MSPEEFSGAENMLNNKPSAVKLRLGGMLKIYQTGRPASVGHLSDVRRTSGGCLTDARRTSAGRPSRRLINYGQDRFINSREWLINSRGGDALWGTAY